MATLLPSLPDCAWKLLWGSTSAAKMGVREQFRVDSCGAVLRLGLTRMDEHRVTEVLCMQPGKEWSNTDCYSLFICYLMCKSPANHPAKEKSPRPEELARWGRGGKQRLSDGKRLAKAAEPDCGSAVTKTHLREGEPTAGSQWCHWPGRHPALHPVWAERCRRCCHPCAVSASVLEGRWSRQVMRREEQGALPGQPHNSSRWRVLPRLNWCRFVEEHNGVKVRA